MFHTDRNGKVVPPSPPSRRAEELASALFELLEAREQLAKAMNSVPSYTAQYSDADYYGDEQQAYNRAVDQFHHAVSSVAGDKAGEALAYSR